MILNDTSIIKLCQEHDMITPFRSDRVQAASYDLSLSPDLIEIVSSGIVTASDHPGKMTRDRQVHVQSGQEYLLQPGAFVLASSAEYVALPQDVAAQVSLKSTAARRGMGHIFAGWIDPGFEGTITFELFSHIPTVLVPGQSICQIVFYQLIDVPAKPYQGRYQYQSGPTPARQLTMDEAFKEAFVPIQEQVTTGYIDAVAKAGDGVFFDIVEEPKVMKEFQVPGEPLGGVDPAVSGNDKTILSEVEIKRGKLLRSIKPSQGIDTARSGGFEWTDDDNA